MTEEKNLKPFWEHLDECRERVIRALIAFMLTTVIFYSFSDSVLDWMIKPIGQLYFTAPSDAFIARMILTLFGGFFLSLPFILFEVWQFVGLGLKEKEKKFIIYFFPGSVGLFLTGVLFGYFVAAPMMLKFFMGFASDNLMPMITVKNYISFIGNITLAFGVVFQLPLVLIFLAKIGIATPEFLIQKRRHAYVLLLIISAIVTPPDIVSMILMGVPLILLYEIGVVAVKLNVSRHKKESSRVVSA